MSPKYYVVFTPGRTGSTLILDNLLALGHIALHRHDNTWCPYNDAFTCILSKRRDRLAAVMSHCAMLYTNEIQHYSNKVSPFLVDPGTFKVVYHNHKTFYDKIQLTAYHGRVVEIWYEDMIPDPYYLFEKLGEIKHIDYGFTEKSPYDYTKLILNYDELKDIAEKIDSQS